MNKYCKLKREIYNKYDIDETVRAVATEINSTYTNKDEVIFIGILKGANRFLSDLTKYILFDHYVDFIAISSYGQNEHQGDVKFLLDTRINVNGKHVILVEDIVDTGKTINYVKNIFDIRGAKSVKICSLLDRGTSNIDIDYIGLTLNTEEWLVGYGLDYREEYRSLNSIYSMEVISN